MDLFLENNFLKYPVYCHSIIVVICYIVVWLPARPAGGQPTVTKVHREKALAALNINVAKAF